MEIKSNIDQVSILIPENQSSNDTRPVLFLLTLCYVSQTCFMTSDFDCFEGTTSLELEDINCLNTVMNIATKWTVSNAAFRIPFFISFYCWS